MMEGLFFRLDKVSYKKKIQLLFGVVVLVPVIVLITFTLFSSVSYIRNEKKSEYTNMVNLNINSLEIEIEQSERSINYIASNYTLHEYLKSSNLDYIERIDYSKVAGALIYNTLLSNQSLKKINIYSNAEIAKSNELVLPANVVENEDWYKKTIASEKQYWFVENGDLYLSKAIIDDYSRDVLGVIKIQLVDDFFTNIFSVFAGEEIKIVVKDREGMIVNNFYNVAIKRAYCIEQELADGQWNIAYEISLDDGVWFYFKRLFFPIIACLLALIVTCLLIVKMFNEEEKKRNIELDLLRSKINPHFLYNNLSAINWIAIEQGENRIYDISTGLASFYRTALNKGKNIDTLDVEYENIRAYLKLQQCAHDECIEIQIDEPENSNYIYTPIFIVQPIIENAIEHGIDMLDVGQGKISVRTYKDENLIIIEVKDNGTELFKRIGSNSLPMNDFGYGLRNVDNRIKLLCNEKYGVNITACETGTTAKIIFDEVLVRRAVEK